MKIYINAHEDKFDCLNIHEDGYYFSARNIDAGGWRLFDSHSGRPYVKGEKPLMVEAITKMEKLLDRVKLEVEKMADEAEL